jgi:cellulose synthase (UDP-forming)
VVARFGQLLGLPADRHHVTIARRPEVSSRLQGPARIIVIAAIAFGAVYLIWRVGWTRQGTQAILFWRLWLAEAVIWVGLLRYAHDGWDLLSTPREPPGDFTVDVVVVCRDEPVEVLRATLLGCQAIRHPHRTVVVDTLGREDLARWTSELGADLFEADVLGLDQPIEAGLASVLGHLDGELVTVLAADHVPLPGLLDELIGDFEDPTVWLAQGRQAFYGPSPGEYRGSATETELLFRILLPGKNFHRAAYWCGSGGLVRRRAIEQLGGIPTATDTPGFQLSIAAIGDGWHSTYHSAPVVLTLARPDLDGFIAQHAVTAQGNLRVLRTAQNPLFAGGLGIHQRLAYLGTLVTYLSGPRRMALMWILCATLITGDLPIRAQPVLLVGMWCAWMGLVSLASQALGRGIGGTLTGNRHRWLLIGAYTGAWVSLLLPRRVLLAIRRPPHSGHLDEPTPRLRLLFVGTALVVLATVWRILAVVGLVDLPPMSATATWITLVLAIGLLLLIAELVVDTRRRTRRRSHRFAVEATAKLGDDPHRVLDLAEGGASIQFQKPPRVGCPYIVTLRVPGLDGGFHQATVAAEVRSVRRLAGPPASGFAVGLSFTHRSPVALARLTEYCRVLLPARDAADAALLPRSPASAPGRNRVRGPAA